MAAIPVFYSFHYANDAMRVQQVRNIGVIENNADLSASDWEEVKRKGDASVERWIDNAMAYRRCVIVLIGSQTAQRPWVRYEIKRGWETKKGLLGIHIHNLKCPRSGTCAKGDNPFYSWNVGPNPMANYVDVYDPSSYDAYNDIARNISGWVDRAIERARTR